EIRWPFNAISVRTVTRPALCSKTEWYLTGAFVLKSCSSAWTSFQNLPRACQKPPVFRPSSQTFPTACPRPASQDVVTCGDIGGSSRHGSAVVAGTSPALWRYHSHSALLGAILSELSFARLSILSRSMLNGFSLVFCTPK